MFFDIYRRSIESIDEKFLFFCVISSVAAAPFLGTDLKCGYSVLVVTSSYQGAGDMHHGQTLRRSLCVQDVETSAKVAVLNEVGTVLRELASGTLVVFSDDGKQFAHCADRKWTTHSRGK